MISYPKKMQLNSFKTAVLQVSDHAASYYYGNDHLSKHKALETPCEKMDQQAVHFLSFPKNLENKSLVRGLLQGSSPPACRGSFLEEA